jgi:hypothetical protein
VDHAGPELAGSAEPLQHPVAGADAGVGERLRGTRKPEPLMAELFPLHGRKNQLNLITRKNRRIKLWVVEKWKSKNQDSHFSTTPSACGSKEKNISKKQRQS